MVEAGPGSAGGYVAFISYSHKDSAVGRWLHRKLEGYRLPKRLAGTHGEDGEVPARLTPIFRDRDELPAAGDLSERVRAALAVSRNLIVLCSPNSAASPWVAKEIATFRELHPGRSILAAIVGGEPDQCFSAVLLEGGAEPLAADLRKEGDGPRLGLLKLVAGLTGVGLDALVQRDAQRRIRRVTYVTAAALTAVLAMSVMTTIAVNARAETQRQRIEAESLVDFMLTDLRDRLRKVGRLDVMQAVNARALHYYGKSASVPGFTEESRARMARIFQAVGEDDLDKDDLDGAFASFREASATTRPLLALFPNDPQLLLDNAKSNNGMGRVHELRHEWDSADRYYRSYAAAAEPLAASALGQAASAATNLGNVAAGRKDYAAAERHYRKAVDLLEMATDLKKGDAHLALMLANAQAWLADTFYRRGMWDRSLQERRRQHAVMARLRNSESRSADADFRYAASDRGLACSLWKTGDRRGAAGLFTRAYNAATALTRRDPHNASWRLLEQKLSDDLLHSGAPVPAAVTAKMLKSDTDDGALGCTRQDHPVPGQQVPARTQRTGGQDNDRSRPSPE
jgi:tetratricopeptide (TPR) repeat protein